MASVSLHKAMTLSVQIYMYMPSIILHMASISLHVASSPSIQICTDEALWQASLPPGSGSQTCTGPAFECTRPAIILHMASIALHMAPSPSVQICTDEAFWQASLPLGSRRQACTGTAQLVASRLPLS